MNERLLVFELRMSAWREEIRKWRNKAKLRQLLIDIKKPKKCKR